LFNVNSAIFQLYHGESKLIFNEMMMMRSLCRRPTRLSWIFIVLAHGNNSLRIDMLPHKDTLFWFQPTSLFVFVFELLMNRMNTDLLELDICW